MSNFLWVFVFVALGISSEVLLADKRSRVQSLEIAPGRNASRKELRTKEVNGDGIIQLGHPVRSNRFDPSRVVQLSWRPRVFLYRDFLSAEETDHLISLVHGKRNSSTSDNASVDAVKFPTTGIPIDAKDPISSRIEERISAWTFLPKGNSWPLHVLHSEGEKSKGNYGYFERDSALKSNEPLMATVILYLSNVTRGGQILFPESENKILSDCTKCSDTLRPTKGNAIVFFNVHLDASPDKSSSHARCPVTDGEMWYAIKFFYLRSITVQKDPVQSDDDTCTDEDENCARWAATGECEKNPVFMVGSPDYYGTCRKSCNVC
ncbi:probable prolyl 4-hydroxylase 12 isoform X2 [Capsicum annuum]|uniref:probable prolyl 4-hydroxylase 12 isoform X2 n=1 Tax=Capsicum annuum TaxID=4072 RepID=UPI001FB184EE|nr:probable prolyl 4-hydroxylase 12 isoform X2 [Capsicum annuum]